MNKQSLSMRGLHACQQGGKSSCRSLSTCRTNLGICSAESEASWDESQSFKVLAAHWPSGSSGPCLLVAPIPHPLFHPGASSSDPLGCTERSCAGCFPMIPKLPPLYPCYAGVQSSIFPSSSVNPPGPLDSRTCGKPSPLKPELGP